MDEKILSVRYLMGRKDFICAILNGLHLGIIP